MYIILASGSPIVAVIHLASECTFARVNPCHVLELKKGENTFKINDEEVSILGVFENFNINKLDKPMGPFMIKYLDDTSFLTKIYIKLHDNVSLEMAIEKIKSTYKPFTNGKLFEIQFINQTLQKQYDREERIGKIITYFTILSLSISSMGIFAMSLFYMQQRRKEIGIRKVNGATILEIINQLNLHFLKWVLIAFIIAVPVAWYISSEWLKQFAYKTPISWWIFGLSGIIVFLIVLITVSWQSYQASKINPIQSLKTE